MKLLRLVCLLVIIPLIVTINVVKWLVKDEDHLS